MKKRKLLYAALILSLVVALSSCFHDHDMSVTVNDDEDIYRMRASFDEDRTAEVQEIINAHLSGHSLSLAHRFVDTDVTLDDGTVFHIKTRPGRLKINFVKTEDSEDCERLKEMCEEIKDIIARQEEYNN